MVDHSSNDIPAWEMCKENAAPLARGRNVKSFEKIIGKVCSKEIEKMLESRKREFECLINLGVTEDPLVHWLSYIKFLQEFVPSDTNAQFLLMERCARTLIHFERYKSDVRFIRLCVLYAEKSDHPGDVFKFLHQHKIGTSVALFWTAWAWIAEQKADYAFAEKLFQKGIAKEAKPLELLKQRHKNFQARMSRHWLSESQNDYKDEEDESGRAALGGLTKKQILRNDRKQRVVPSVMAQSNNNRQSTFITRQISRSVSSDKGKANGTASGGFEIFSDENKDPDDNGYNLNDSHLEPLQDELETDEAKKKENIMAPERWNDRGGYVSQVVRPSQGSLASACPTFEIHIDEECEAQHSNEIQELTKQFESGGRAFQRREREDLAEKLARDPTRYMKNPEKLKKDIS
jgi:Mad3/BUB1 homology region 1